jgi:hypothetical protein
MKKVGIFVPSLNHFTETLIYWLIEGEIEVSVITSFETSSHDVSEHSWSLERLKDVPEMKLVSLETTAQELDYLMFSCCRYSQRERKILNSWRKNSKHITIFSSSVLKQWKGCLKELFYAFPYYIEAESAILEMSARESSPYFFVKNKLHYTPFPHPQFFWSEEKRSRMFSPIQSISDSRAFKFNFIGSQSPPERALVLEQVKNTLKQIENINFIEQYPIDTTLDSKVNVLYIEYRSTGRRGIGSSNYIEALSQTDFCISPMGWGDNWTHRTIEALLRGALPILEDPDRYNIGLQDMQNCIVVRDNNWTEAIERAYQLDAEMLTRMRENTQKLRERYLLPNVAALRLKRSIGLSQQSK